jgi:hypothetical protein
MIRAFLLRSNHPPPAWLFARAFGLESMAWWLGSHQHRRAGVASTGRARQLPMNQARPTAPLVAAALAVRFHSASVLGINV